MELKASDVRKGYFAEKNGEYLEREKAIAENKEAYDLIMKDKERLLSFDEPTEFIFTHSALKEGWDSPNVFNICTLNTTVSTMKKRQEIGRGMRLCVNQEGARVFDRNINLLSVIANEHYSDYVSKSTERNLSRTVFIRLRLYLLTLARKELSNYVKDLIKTRILPLSGIGSLKKQAIRLKLIQTVL